MGSVEDDVSAAPDPRRRRRRLWVRLLLGALVTIALLAALLSLTRRDELGEQLRKLRWGPILVALLAQWTVYLIRAARFWLLTPQVPPREMTAIAGLHILALRIFPLRSGELVYPLLLRRSGESTLATGLLGLAMLRLLDAVVVVAGFGVVLALTSGLQGEGVRHSLVASATVAGVGALAVIAFPRLLTLSLSLIRAVATATRLAQRQLVARLLHRLEEAVRAHRQIKRRVMAQQAALTVIHWPVNYAAIMAVLHALGLGASFSQAVLGGTAAVVSAFLPIGGIGSFGTLETGWTVGFVLVGLSRAEAVASGLVYSLVTFVCAALFAVVTSIVRPRRPRSP